MASRRPRFPKSSRISRSTPVGETPWPRRRWRRRCFTRVASEPISFLPLPARFCRWTRRPSRNERHRSNKTSAPFRRAWWQYTSDPLFHDLWRRPALAPRDRSLVTVSALIASDQVAQITFHLNRAMDNGLTKAEASEVLTHLLFYAGWPNVMSAVPVATDVFEKRPK